jgi:hypothetical protein
MRSTTFRPTAAGVDTRSLRDPLLVLLISTLGFAVSRRGMTHLGQWSELFSSIVVVVVFAAAVAFRRVRYQDMSAPLRITIRATGIIGLIQLVFGAFGPFPGPPNVLFGGHGSALYSSYVAIPGVVAGVAALWRPSFLAALFLYCVGWRELIGTISGIHVVDTDYLGMIDVGYFATLGTFVVIYATSPWALDRFPFLHSLWLGPEESKAVQTRAFNLIWACAVGAHLGSYFWSGIAKIQLGGDYALTWVLAPLAALSVSVLSAFGLLYDFFHIGVYFTLGARLFFWIALNLVIVAAAALPRNGIIPAMKTVMALTILFGHYFYYTNHLGWLDTAKLSSPQFYAVTRDNRQVEVPFNYFGIYSYTIAQTAMHVADSHFPFRPAGNALDPKPGRTA